MKPGLGYLPIIWSAFSLGAPIIGYAVAVYNNHVFPLLPAISDIGSMAPEANLFSMLMNLSIIACLFNIYVRYCQCDLQIRHCRDIKDTLVRLNRTGVLFAAFSVLGGIIVSNFQSSQDQVLTGIHDIGAVLLFTFGGFYFWIQTIMAYLMKPYGIYSSCLCHLRLVLTTTISLCSIAFFTASTYGYKKFLQNNHNHKIGQWKPGDGGYVLHFIGNLCEWVTLFAFIGMSLTFVPEFQEVSIQMKCKEKKPRVVSAYTELSEYASLKLNSEERHLSDEDQSPLEN